jgi:hypothetical protein
MKQTRKTTFAAACGLLLVVTLVSSLTAQAVSKSSVDVTVTDARGRFVSGLEKSHFAVSEGGVQRSITAFTELRDDDQKQPVHYKLEFESPNGTPKVDVMFNPPPGLPPLTVTWK